MNRSHSSEKSKQSHWRVAAVQMKFAPSIDENLELIDRRVKEAARKGADVVLFPECATTGYACDFTKLTRAQIASALLKVAASARDAKINVLVGSAAHLKRGLANCLIAFDRSGREAG